MRNTANQINMMPQGKQKKKKYAEHGNTRKLGNITQDWRRGRRKGAREHEGA